MCGAVQGVFLRVYGTSTMTPKAQSYGRKCFNVENGICGKSVWGSFCTGYNAEARVIFIMSNLHDPE